MSFPLTWVWVGCTICNLQPRTEQLQHLVDFPRFPFTKLKIAQAFPNCAFEHHCTGARGLYCACPKIGSVPSYFDQGCRSGNDKSAVGLLEASGTTHGTSIVKLQIIVRKSSNICRKSGLVSLHNFSGLEGFSSSFAKGQAISSHPSCVNHRKWIQIEKLKFILTLQKCT